MLPIATANLTNSIAKCFAVNFSDSLIHISSTFVHNPIFNILSNYMSTFYAIISFIVLLLQYPATAVYNYYKRKSGELNSLS